MNIKPAMSSNKGSFENLYFKSQNFILIAAIAYVFFYLGMFKQVAFFSPIVPIAKFITPVCLWLSIFTLPWKQKKNKIFIRRNIIVLILLFFSVFSIFHTIFSTDPWLDKIGNRYITLIGNPDTSLTMLAPLYYFFPEMLDKRFFKMLLFLISASLVFYFQPYIPLITFLIPFLYKNKFFRILLVISIIEGIISIQQGVRIYGIFSVLFIILYFSPYIKIKRSFIFIILFILISLTSFLFYQTLTSEYSIFDYLSNINSIDNTDTRTFLFKELYQDMSDTNTLFAGKGAYSVYFSDYFYNQNESNGDFYMRIGAEVSMLLFLQKSGFIFVIILIILYIISIKKSLLNSNSPQMKSIGITLSLWLIISFISSLPGHNIMDAISWCIMGMCNSKSYLKLSQQSWMELYKK